MTKPNRLEIDLEQLNALLDRIEQHKLAEADFPLIADLIRSIAWLSQTLEDQNITIHRLRKIFGFKTERTSNLPNGKPNEKNPEKNPDCTSNENDSQRPEEMATPTQMCDASSNNTPDRNQTDEGNCLAHLRRKFFEIAEIWPTYVLPIIALQNTLFKNDREAREQGLDEAQTFALHQMKSAPILDELKIYCTSLIDDKKTEPNSNLGKAINYMFNHWEGFTLFLRKPGVPLDNNADERLMKRAVLNRKNGLFFKTEFGAYVGDILLSVVETCQLNKINPYHYLITVQTYQDQIKKDPSIWLPWNFTETIASLGLKSSDDTTPIQFAEAI